MRHLWFPIFFLVFAIKIPDRAWSLIASQLQGIVSGGGHFVLDLLSKPLNFSVGLHGHTLEVTPTTGGVAQKLNVAEACSGMRSLMTFTVLGTALAFLGTRPIWQRVILLASILPVALVMNICRITTLGLLTAYGKHDLAHGDFHTMIGLLMLVPAAGTFVLIGWVLNRIFLDDNKATKKQATPVKNNAPSPAYKQQPQPSNESNKQIPKGFALGACLVLASLVFYAGNIAAFQPKSISEHLTTPLAVVITFGALVLLAVSLWLTKKTTNKPQTNSVAFTATLLIASMAMGAVAQNRVIDMTQAVLIKNAVPLRHPLEEIATDFGTWTMIQREPRLSSEIEEELGTKDYITLIYEDLAWPRNQPGGRIRLHIPYYTGTIDTVPHVPDRCFVAGGATDRQLAFPTLKLDATHFNNAQNGHGFIATTQLDQEVHVPSTDIPVTQFQYSTPGKTFANDQLSTVFYFFLANGRCLATPEHVRAQGFDPRDKYAYFAKVEIQPLEGINEQGQLATLNAEDAKKRTEAFLTQALPEIMRCLPDWQAVQAGQWPPAQTANNH